MRVRFRPRFIRLTAFAMLALGASAPEPAAAAPALRHPLLSVAELRAAADREPSFVERGVGSTPQPVLYVADFYTSKIEMFAVSGGTRRRVGHLGFRDGILGPTDLYVDQQRNLWVTNAANGLAYVSEYAPGQTHPERVLRAVGGLAFTSVFAAPDGTVYIGTTGPGVAIFSPGATYPKFHSLPNTSFVPGIAGDAAGNVYAFTFAAQGGGNVFVYDAARKHWHPTPITVAQPGGIALDPSGNIVVSDTFTGTGVISVYANGTYQKVSSFPCRVTCWQLAFDTAGTDLWYLEPLIAYPPSTGMYEFSYPGGTFEKRLLIYLAKKNNPEPNGLAYSPAMPLPNPPASTRGRASIVSPQATFYDATARPRVYVADVTRGQVIVYGGAAPFKRIATYQLFGYPAGLAVDRAGNLYVADAENMAIYLFAPGAKQPTLTLSAGLYVPNSVNANGPGGDIAVADFCSGGFDACMGPGDVAIFPAGATQPSTRLTDKRLTYVFGAAYDAKGNIYADGLSAQSVPVVGTFAANTSTFTPWKIATPIHYPGGVAVLPNGDVSIVDQGTGTKRSVSRLRIFEPGKAKEKRALTIGAPGNDVLSVAFADGGASFFTANYTAGTSQQLSYPTGSPLGTILDLTGLPYAVAVSPEVAP